MQGRLGYRFMPYLGIEGELATGLKGDTDTMAGVHVNTKLKHEAAIYGVGFLPVSPNTDLLARVGYGTAQAAARRPAFGLGLGGIVELRRRRPAPLRRRERRARRLHPPGVQQRPGPRQRLIRGLHAPLLGRDRHSGGRIPRPLKAPAACVGKLSPAAENFSLAQTRRPPPLCW